MTSLVAILHPTHGYVSYPVTVNLSVETIISALKSHSSPPPTKDREFAQQSTDGKKSFNIIFIGIYTILAF